MDARAIGDRVRQAREALDMGQQALASKIGLARPVLSAIENGKREVSAAELVAMSDALARPLDYFLGRAAQAFDFQPLLRVLPPEGQEEEAPTRGRPPRGEGTSVVRRTLVRFEELCRMYLELERLGRLAVPELPKYAIDPGRGGLREAERIADLARTQLGLGPTLPAVQLRELMEERLAIKTFVLAAESPLSGACIFHEEVGGCVLVVAKAIPHMLYTLAHELGHLLVHRETPTVDENIFGLKTPSEQFANAFAANLLMPRAAMQELFAAVYRSRAEFGALEVIHMARHFGVSFPAMLWRLQNLRLITPKSKEKLEAARPGGGTGRVSRVEDKPRYWYALPERYVFLALGAYYREEISIGRLAELLCQEDGEPRTIDQTEDFLAIYEEQAHGHDGPSTALGEEDDVF
jgi:Zn-dependent peptidase ImmA (M78 family)/transcriptional regulator with XRE-family HTH domain